MNNCEKIREIVSKQGIITTKQVEEKNIPRWFLTEMVRKGELEKISRGMYVNEDGLYDEFFIFQNRHKTAIFSYSNALYFHDLSEKIPSRIEVTVYQGYNTHRFNKDTITHYVKRDIHKLGMIEMKSTYGNKIFVYDIERCMCDLVKSRKVIESEVFRKALQRYIKMENKDLKKLYRYARKMDVESEVYNIMEILS